MKVACVQPKIANSNSQAYDEIERLLKETLDKNGPLDIVCLPERWFPFSEDLDKNFQPERGEHYLFVKTLAKNYGVNLIGGAIWEKRKSTSKPSITSYYFDKNGEEIGRQDKIHLYSYERNQFQSNKELNLFKLNENYFAILICFDMAFYETPRLAVENGADLLLSPTQIREEGLENWAIYLKARALENRVPVAACNSVGALRDRRYLGQSKIISFVKGFVTPSKLKIVEGPLNESGFIFDDIDFKFPKKLRKIRVEEEKIEMSEIKINIIND